MDKVQHFEIPADDLGRAKEFYREVFDWRLEDANVPGMEYVMAYTTEVDEKQMTKETNVINGGMMKRSGVAAGPVIVLTVEDIQVSLGKIREHGGTVLTEIMPVGDMGLYAYIKDTEGNVIGVWQNVKKS